MRCVCYLENDHKLCGERKERKKESAQDQRKRNTKLMMARRSKLWTAKEKHEQVRGQGLSLSLSRSHFVSLTRGDECDR